ncbi:hypothetical protein UFOVP1309_56 [uncultured Caudovirales phage]|uniref:Uncharacterized protein n=1 Tax=uncultured Caudovirales phage TaxID=2100421 RepID=A0A6J5S068_9CAUD|nr:hypothetical protein UFOVP1309_56 [uncultured Caudovirales phage]
MNEREELEMAAKAAGYAFAWGKDWHDVGEPQVDGSPWNPRKDDGDALRLAVKLNIVPASGEEFTSVYCHRLGTLWCMENRVETNGDPYAATRLAIVRAAAEIGKAMK